jgi:predicted PurR-regulated permease PerM
MKLLQKARSYSVEIVLGTLAILILLLGFSLFKIISLENKVNEIGQAQNSLSNDVYELSTKEPDVYSNQIEDIQSSLSDISSQLDDIQVNLPY